MYLLIDTNKHGDLYYSFNSELEAYSFMAKSILELEPDLISEIDGNLEDLEFCKRLIVLYCEQDDRRGVEICPIDVEKDVPSVEELKKFYETH